MRSTPAWVARPLWSWVPAWPKLAQSAQVLVVTHLPQVASWADEQYVVAKGETKDGSIATTISQVRGDERVHEIARMLSGSESETSLEHAEELLKSSVLD